MNVSGLNNLKFPSSTSSASQGKVASGKEKSAFESLMGRVQGEKPEAPKEQSGQDQVLKNPTKATPDTPALKSTRPELPPTAQEESATEVGVREIEALDTAPDSLPTSSGFPSLTGPSIADRPLGVPVAATVGAPAGARAPVVPEDDGANSLTRRVVWNDFLRKMSGLGISVEDVMGAFASLSEKELAQPPAQSVESVVAALGLNDQQALLARQYFGELIQKTQSKSMGDELKASSKQISLTLMSQRELQRKALAKSLDNLDRNFFMQPTPEQQAKGIQARDLRAMEQPSGPQAEKSREAMLAAALGENPRPEMAEPAFPKINKLSLTSDNTAALAQNFAMGSRAQGSTAAAPTPVVPSMNVQELNALVDQMQDTSAEGKVVAADLLKNFVGRQGLAGASAQAALPMSAAQVGGQITSASTAAAVPVAPPDVMASLSSLLSGDTESDDSGEQMTDSSALSGMPTGGERFAGMLGKTEFQGQLANAMAPAPTQPVTVPELVQQAQVLVHNGGGEMKVTMHPEGLGEVALRVSVDGGKVQVHMITESDEAKALIERSLSELKSGLAQNQLSVETIKIDTASNLGRQLEQQYHEAQREAAQQSLAQFRQDHQGWRRSFFDTPTVRQYSSQNEAPTDVGAAGKSSSSSRRGTNSRRLDLVA